MTQRPFMRIRPEDPFILGLMTVTPGLVEIIPFPLLTSFYFYETLFFLNGWFGKKGLKR